MPGLNYGVEVTETFIVRDALSQGVFVYFTLQLGMRLMTCFLPPGALPLNVTTMMMVVIIAGALHDYRRKRRGYGFNISLVALAGLFISLILWHLQYPWLVKTAWMICRAGDFLTITAGAAMLAVHGIRLFRKMEGSLQWVLLGAWLMAVNALFKGVAPDMWLRSGLGLDDPLLRGFALFVAWGGVLVYIMDPHHPNMEVSR